MNSQTRLYGVLGHPISHSLSPLIHNAAFRHCGINAAYLAFDVDADTLGLAFEGIRNLGILGVNLTIPLKEAALDYIDEIPEDLDRATGAINTVVNKDGMLLGYNTDGLGFLMALREELRFKPEGKSVLVLGAGGAARAVVFVLARAHADIIRVHNRTPERAVGLVQYAETFFPETDLAAVSSLEDLSVPKFDLVINTTSCGMKTNKDIPMPWKYLTAPRAAYDLVYSPAETPWLHEAKKLGIPVTNGLGMLANQAALSFELWTGKKEGVRELMHKELSACLT